MDENIFTIHVDCASIGVIINCKTKPQKEKGNE
jgi:hypothetical protein